MNIGLFNAASSMNAQLVSMDVISNNLANVNTTAFKKDEVLFKAFPERMMSLYHDNVVRFPLGSYDHAPVVGRLGMGVEVNDIFTRFEKRDGENIIPLQKTGHKFDVALSGEGFLSIETPKGIRYSRAGAFTKNQEGFLTDMNGFFVLGSKGPIQLGEGELKIDEQGEILVKKPLETDYTFIDRLSLVDFYDKRGLVKEGKNFYQYTQEAGEIIKDNLPDLKIMQGFLEGSNVNPVRAMTQMIEVQRLYEASQKAIQTADQILDKEVNEVGKTR